STDGPTSPGVGLWRYHAACIGSVTGGTSTVPSALRPTGSSDERAPMRGIDTETGCDGGIPSLVTARFTGGASRVEAPAGGPAFCGGSVEHPDTHARASTSAASPRRYRPWRTVDDMVSAGPWPRGDEAARHRHRAP